MIQRCFSFLFGFCLLGTLFASFGFAENQLDTRSLTLKEAVQKCIAQNPDLLKVRKQVDEVQATYGSSRAVLFPTIGAQLTAEHKKDAVLGSSALFGGEGYNKYFLTAQLTQPLFQFGVISGVQAAHRGVELQERAYLIAERGLTAQVIQAFYSLLLQNSNIQALEHVQSVEKESLSTAQYRFRIGRGQNLDVLQVKTQLALIEPQIETARVASHTAVLDLVRLMGDAGGEALTIQGTLEIPRLVRLADKKEQKHNLEDLPEFQQSQIQLEQTELQKDALLGKNWPSLSAYGNWGRTSYTRSDLLDNAASSWAIGLQLTVPLFSGLSSFYDRSAQAAKVAESEAALESNRRLLLTQQAQNHQNLDLSEKNVKSALEAFGLAKASLQEAQKNYKFASIDYLQLLSVQQAYFQAQSALNQARYAYIVSAINYSVSSGIPLSELIDFLSETQKGDA